MKRKILPGSPVNPGTRERTKAEKSVEDLNFVIHQCTNRSRPSDSRRVVIFPIFAEFGSEMLAPLYIIPYLLKNKYQGKYSIVMGWYGRKYLYEHLVDEFWELDEKHQWLREYCRALHNDSKNLKKATEKASQYGTVIPRYEIENMCVNPPISTCTKKFGNVQCNAPVYKHDTFQQCSRCGQTYPSVGLYFDIEKYKKQALWIPSPSENKIKEAKKYLKPNSVGIIARGRKCYGRNLDSKFYLRLIYLLEDLGYDPIWLGEKATTIACPSDRIFDYSRYEGARDLELTLAIVSQLKFTIQFWTASTRLSGLVGTPFILFESPDQIWSEYATGGKVYIPSGKGQEGYRISLCTKGDKKIVAAHYHNVVNDNTTALNYVKQAVLEVEKGDFTTIVGQVEGKEYVAEGIRRNNSKVGLK